MALCVAMAAAVAMAMAAVVDVSRTLPDDIVTTLIRQGPDPERNSLIIVCGSPTGAARGIQSGLIALLIGGAPAAMLATSLAAFSRRARHRWSATWAPLFLAGFAFQASSMAFSALLLTLAFLVDMVRGESLLFLVNVVGGGIGLRCWLALRRNIREETLTVFARG